MQKVLLVCLGNICRSPTAHGILSHKLKQQGVNALVDSCGTGAWHAGSPPDDRAIKVAQSKGYDLSSLRARQLKKNDFDQFDYILAMDARNLADVIKVAPSNYSGVIGLFLDYAKHLDMTEVPDPYYGGSDSFHRVIEMLEQAADGLIENMATIDVV